MILKPYWVFVILVLCSFYYVGAKTKQKLPKFSKTCDFANLLRNLIADTSMKNLEIFSKICTNCSGLNDDSLKLLKYLKEGELAEENYNKIKQHIKSSSSKYEKYKPKKEICELLKGYRKKIEDIINERIDNFLRSLEETDTYFKLHNSVKHDQKWEDTKARYALGHEDIPIRENIEDHLTYSDSKKIKKKQEKTSLENLNFKDNNYRKTSNLEEIKTGEISIEKKSLPDDISEHDFQNRIAEKLSTVDEQEIENLLKVMLSCRLQSKEHKSSSLQRKLKDTPLYENKTTLLKKTKISNNIPQTNKDIVQINRNENLGANRANEIALEIGSRKNTKNGNEKKGYGVKLTNIWYTNIEISKEMIFKWTLGGILVMLAGKLINSVLNTVIASFMTRMLQR